MFVLFVFCSVLWLVDTPLWFPYPVLSFLSAINNEKGSGQCLDSLKRERENLLWYAVVEVDLLYPFFFVLTISLKGNICQNFLFLSLFRVRPCVKLL